MRALEYEFEHGDALYSRSDGYEIFWTLINATRHAGSVVNSAPGKAHAEQQYNRLRCDSDNTCINRIDTSETPTYDVAGNKGVSDQRACRRLGDVVKRVIAVKS